MQRSARKPATTYKEESEAESVSRSLRSSSRPSRTRATKSTTARSTLSKQTPVRKTPVRRTSVKKTVEKSVKKTPVKRTSVKKTIKKTPVKKSPKNDAEITPLKSGLLESTTTSSQKNLSPALLFIQQNNELADKDELYTVRENRLKYIPSISSPLTKKIIDDDLSNDDENTVVGKVMYGFMKKGKSKASTIKAALSEHGSGIFHDLASQELERKKLGSAKKRGMENDVDELDRSVKKAKHVKDITDDVKTSTPRIVNKSNPSSLLRSVIRPSSSKKKTPLKTPSKPSPESPIPPPPSTGTLRRSSRIQSRNQIINSKLTLGSEKFNRIRDMVHVQKSLDTIRDDVSTDEYEEEDDDEEDEYDEQEQLLEDGRNIRIEKEDSEEEEKMGSHRRQESDQEEEEMDEQGDRIITTTHQEYEDQLYLKPKKSCTYFSRLGDTTTKTSDNTLTKFPSLTTQEYKQQLAKVTKHAQPIKDLFALQKRMFPQWELELSRGFNLVLYGFGSKFELLKKFGDEICAEDGNVIHVKGFFPNVNLKGILGQILNLIRYKGKLGSVNDQIEIIQKYYSYDTVTPLYLIIHNIDGQSLRPDSTQLGLARLSSCLKIKLIASIDHINAPLLWDNMKKFLFNFIWHDATTSAPYDLEISYENSMLGKLVTATSEKEGEGGGVGLEQVIFVLKTLPRMAIRMFAELVEYQINAMKKAGGGVDEEDDGGGGKDGIGLSYRELFHRCQQSFFTTSDSHFRQMLTEFKDHDLIRQSGDELVVPMHLSVLERVLGYVNEK